MIQARKHEFHIIMTDTMIAKLLNVHLFGSRYSLSGVIVGIISLIDPLIITEHRWGKQRMSRYQPVSDNPDEKRVHAHVYFTEDEYRKIKMLHADLNCFSIAQLVRWLLELFLALIEEFGDRLIEELKKRFQQWSTEDNRIQQNHRGNLRQLSKIIQHLPGRNRLLSIYTSHYTPFWILRL
ncbi:MAG: hypothetical protein JW881_11965 [Spirochaetales bacterium]|nr:hypothetical protein [Spirochaetales bacterium]